jgi:hypothetical protein
VEAHLGELFTDEDAEESGPTEAESQPIDLPVPITEAEREQLAGTNDDRHEPLRNSWTPC